MSAARIAAVLGKAEVRLTGLAGGCVGEVYLVEADGERWVAKVDSGGSAHTPRGFYLE